MLKRFTSLEDSVKHTLALSDTDLSTLITDEWDVVKQLCTLLEPCAKTSSVKDVANKLLQSISHRFPNLEKSKSLSICTFLDPTYKQHMFEDECSVKDVANKLLQSISHRFPNLEKSKSLSICTFLDPTYKQHMFEDECSVKDVANKLLQSISHRFPNLEKSKSLSICTFLDPTYKQHMFEDECSVKDVANKLLESISHRFPNLEKSKSLSICTFLDPTYKQHIMFEDKSSVESVKRHTIELVTGLINRTTKVKASDTEDKDELPSEKKKVSVWDDYKKTISKVKPMNTMYTRGSEVRQEDDDSKGRKKIPLNGGNTIAMCTQIWQTLLNLIATLSQPQCHAKEYFKKLAIYFLTEVPY
ncbi:Fatty acid 2-hydroxylase [Homalodisca vitripennis]|nr:Fatty acid 2-hydroxylase [Homalodisca vitripennis]